MSHFSMAVHDITGRVVQMSSVSVAWYRYVPCNWEQFYLLFHSFATARKYRRYSRLYQTFCH